MAAILSLDRLQASTIEISGSSAHQTGPEVYLQLFIGKLLPACYELYLSFPVFHINSPAMKTVSFKLLHVISFSTSEASKGIMVIGCICILWKQIRVFRIPVFTKTIGLPLRCNHRKKAPCVISDCKSKVLPSGPYRTDTD